MASESGVPIVRGSPNLSSAKECQGYIEKDEISLPAIMKAAYGGGGRGMRIVRSLSDIAPSFESCKRESYTAFGRDEVFIEEFWEKTKHLEVQIIADGQGGVIHLFERDCTVQHRHQKVIELAPACNIHPDSPGATVGLCGAFGETLQLQRCWNSRILSSWRAR